jgi:hypothetical protein
MRPRVPTRLAIALVLSTACATAPGGMEPSAGASESATLAQIYFWRAKPDRVADYARYVREVAEPIDREAQRSGAFLSVTTYQSADSTVPWTHMRVFLLRDSAQWRGLAPSLAAAGARLEPDSLRRRERSAYGASLRDPAGSTLVRLVR